MAASTDKIKCAICGKEVHAIGPHLHEQHKEVSLEQYQTLYPGAPVLSEYAKQMIEERARKSGSEDKSPMTDNKVELAKLFNLDESLAGVKNARGKPVMVSVIQDHAFPDLVPDRDDDYVFELENTKNSLMALELGLPLMLWGHTGTGKTTLIKQIASRTNRPIMRVQHTINTEESHIVGQWTAKGGETVFELGPLALAMKHGWLYIADEYDFAMPSVLSVYQPILEGDALVIKEADAANRVIRPHPNFRFAATGNTNGSGDEHNLYQGTNIQNAANYDRFNMVLEVKYMTPALEIEVIVKQTKIPRDEATQLVDFANRVRESFAGSKISSPISPRTLIAIANIGIRKDSYRSAIALSFSNKLPRVDKEVVDGLAQRIFGK